MRATHAATMRGLYQNNIGKYMRIADDKPIRCSSLESDLREVGSRGDGEGEHCGAQYF